MPERLEIQCKNHEDYGSAVEGKNILDQSDRVIGFEFFFLSFWLANVFNLLIMTLFIMGRPIMGKNIVVQSDGVIWSDFFEVLIGQYFLPLDLDLSFPYETRQSFRCVPRGKNLFYIVQGQLNKQENVIIYRKLTTCIPPWVKCNTIY